MEMFAGFDEDNLTFIKNNSDTNDGPEYYQFYTSSFNYKEFFSAFRFQLDQFLWKYMTIVVTLLSIFGNTIVVLVLMRKKNRLFSTSIFITNLAISDIMVSLSAFEGFLLIHKYIRETYSDFDCKFRTFIPKAAQYVSVWMLVFISVERAMSVKLPLKVKSIFTVRFARNLVIIVWGLSIAKASINVMITKLQDNVSGSPACFLDILNFPALYYVDLILYSSLAVIIPYPIVLICTIITISSLLQNKLRKSKSNKAQVKSITVTLVIVNVVYLLSVAPAVIYEIYSLAWIRFNKFLQWTIVDFYNYVVLLNIFSFVSFLHHAVNFLIYFLSGSRFRAETKAMMSSCIRQRQKRTCFVNDLRIKAYYD